MQLATRHFGNIDIDENGTIDFPEGLPGFEDVKRFVLLAPDENSPFQWLQGVDNTDLALVVIDPKQVRSDYIVDVYDSEVEILDIKDTEKVIVLSIVVVPEDISKMTANFRAPVLINSENRKGRQVVQKNDVYSIKHYIIEGLQKMGGSK